MQYLFCFQRAPALMCTIFLPHTQTCTFKSKDKKSNGKENIIKIKSVQAIIIILKELIGVCWFVLNVNLPKPRITLEMIIERLSLGMCDMCVGLSLLLIDIERPNPLWKVSFPRQTVISYMRHGKSR